MRFLTCAYRVIRKRFAESRLGVTTVSVGLAMLHPERSDSVHDVRKEAEYALSEAIRLGRNCVVELARAPA